MNATCVVPTTTSTAKFLALLVDMPECRRDEQPYSALITFPVQQRMLLHTFLDAMAQQRLNTTVGDSSHAAAGGPGNGHLIF